MASLALQKPWAHDPQLKEAFYQYAMAYSAHGSPRGKFLATKAEPFYQTLKIYHQEPTKLMTGMFLSVAQHCNAEAGRTVPKLQESFDRHVLETADILTAYPALTDRQGLRAARYDVQVMALCELAVRTEALRKSIEDKGLRKGDVQTMQVYCDALDELDAANERLGSKVRKEINVIATALLETDKVMKMLRF